MLPPEQGYNQPNPDKCRSGKLSSETSSLRSLLECETVAKAGAGQQNAPNYQTYLSSRP